MERDVQGPPAVPEIVRGAERRPPRLWVRRPANTRGINVVCLSPRLYSYGIHYVPQAKRDVGCAGSWERCHFCRESYDWREKHYLAVLTPVYFAIELLELSDGAVRYCPQVADVSRDLRGLWVKAVRMYDKKNSPERVILGGRWTEGNLPPEPDVYAELLRYWHPLVPDEAGRAGGAP